MHCRLLYNVRSTIATRQITSKSPGTKEHRPKCEPALARRWLRSCPGSDSHPGQHDEAYGTFVFPREEPLRRRAATTPRTARRYLAAESNLTPPSMARLIFSGLPVPFYLPAESPGAILTSQWITRCTCPFVTDCLPIPFFSLARTGQEVTDDMLLRRISSNLLSSQVIVPSSESLSMVWNRRTCCRLLSG